MGISVPQQLWTFLYSIAYGVALGVFYDLFRVFRLIFIPSSVSAFLQDILFWMVSGVVTFMYMFSFNDGSVRFYMLCGVFLGWILYYFTLGSWIYAFFRKVIGTLKRWICRFFWYLFWPARWLLQKIRPLCVKSREKSNKFLKNAISLFHFRKKHNKMNNVKYQYARIDARRRRKYEKKKAEYDFYADNTAGMRRSRGEHRIRPHKHR